MLHGTKVHLRMVRDADLEVLHAGLSDLEARGEYFPITVHPEAWLRKRVQETGLWDKDDGLLLILDADDRVIGHIEFFKPVDYLDGLELSYLIYDRSARGQGVTTEAVGLLTRYVFDVTKTNRIQLVIHPENIASRRIAEKNGYRHEGTMRGAWYNRGRYHDVEVYALLREEHRAIRRPAE